MANRRMVSKSISLSKQVNKMSEFAQLLFTWSIAHADDFGCMNGDPEVVLATVIPLRRDRTSEDVESAITEWVQSDLVWWYAIENEAIIQFRTWDEHQTGLNKRTKSKYILYDEAKSCENFREILRNSSLTELNRTELNRKEENDESLVVSTNVIQKKMENTKDSSSSPNEFGLIARAFQEEGFGPFSPLIAEKLKVLYDDFGYEWMMDAFAEAATQGVRKLSYVERTLGNWKREGHVHGVNIRIEAAATKEQHSRDRPLGPYVPNGIPEDLLELEREREEMRRHANGDRGS